VLQKLRLYHSVDVVKMAPPRSKGIINSKVGYVHVRIWQGAKQSTDDYGPPSSLYNGMYSLRVRGVMQFSVVNLMAILEILVFCLENLVGFPSSCSHQMIDTPAHPCEQPKCRPEYVRTQILNIFNWCFLFEIFEPGKQRAVLADDCHR
jgi:hypothetical protein